MIMTQVDFEGFVVARDSATKESEKYNDRLLFSPAFPAVFHCDEAEWTEMEIKKETQEKVICCAELYCLSVAFV